MVSFLSPKPSFSFEGGNPLFVPFAAIFACDVRWVIQLRVGTPASNGIHLTHETGGVHETKVS